MASTTHIGLSFLAGVAVTAAAFLLFGVGETPERASDAASQKELYKPTSSKSQERLSGEMTSSDSSQDRRETSAHYDSAQISLEGEILKVSTQARAKLSEFHAIQPLPEDQMLEFRQKLQEATDEERVRLLEQLRTQRDLIREKQENTLSDFDKNQRSRYEKLAQLDSLYRLSQKPIGSNQTKALQAKLAEKIYAIAVNPELLPIDELNREWEHLQDLRMQLIQHHLDYQAAVRSAAHNQ